MSFIGTFACSVFFFIVVCLFCILYFISIFLLLLPTWRIKLMMMMMMMIKSFNIFVQLLLSSLSQFYKQLCCRKEAARCFVSVSSQLQQYKTSSGVFYCQLRYVMAAPMISGSHSYITGGHDLRLHKSRAKYYLRKYFFSKRVVMYGILYQVMSFMLIL